MTRKRAAAFAYLRTSSATNVGADRDSEKRQREALRLFAKGASFEIAAEFYDAAVSGADPIGTRPGFAEMLARVSVSDVRVVLVETADRFARDLVVQETGHKMLRDLGIELIAADSPDSFADDTPTATLVRQILGAVAQFEKAALVAKLKGARERKRRATGKCGGRRSHVELHPAVVAEAKRLRRASPRTKHRLSFAKIAGRLAAAGHLNIHGRPYAPKSVRAMITR